MKREKIGRLLLARAVAGSLLLPTIAQADSPATPPTPAQNPGLWITTQDYPAAAERSGQQGTVGVTLSVSQTGDVTDCTVTQSSDVPDLDSAACRFLTKRAKFNPARDGIGNPVPGQYIRRIKWIMPIGNYAMFGELFNIFSDSSIIFHAIVEKDGGISQCAIDSSSGKSLNPDLGFNPEDICDGIKNQRES